MFESVIAAGAEITALGRVARAGAGAYRGGETTPLRFEEVDVVFAGSPTELRAWNGDHARYRALLNMILALSAALFATSLWFALR